MKIIVDYDVHAATLEDAMSEAESRLTAFAPTLDQSGWQVTLHCSPSSSITNGDAVLWHVSVEAQR